MPRNLGITNLADLDCPILRDSCMTSMLDAANIKTANFKTAATQVAS